MKRLFIYLSSLLIPLLIVMIILEVVVTEIPNSYSYKYKYVKNHGNSIKVIAIGHSQIYDGFDPVVFGKGAFNLGNSSQEFIDDYYILKELLDDMPNLKVVIMPIGYSDVSLSSSKFDISERGSYYHEYMNIDYDGQLPLKYRYECINIPKSCKKIYDYYVLHEDIVGCDSLGRRNKYKLENRTWKLEDNKVISKYYSLKDTSGFVIRGEQFLKKIVDMLSDRHVRLVLVSTPYYHNSLKELNIFQQGFADNSISSFSQKYKVLYLNYQYSEDFNENDFFDEAHLSERGARKFSKMLLRQISDLQNRF